MATWNGLPTELRGLILEHLAHSAVAERRSKSSKGRGTRHDMGSYSVVCRQWQGFIEKINFSSLEINSVKDLSRFDELLQDPRRRSLLRRLSLRVELPRYASKLAKIPENDAEQNANEVAFTQGIWNLFDILSKWTPQASGDIELELSAYSPSDKAKLFGEEGLDQDGNSRFFDHDLDFSFITAGCEQVGRHGLPEVSVVSSCHVLRRNHRNFSSRSLLTIFCSLPRLKEVRYEPWHQVDMEAQLEVDSDYARNLPFWPSHIKRISIFEHFDAFNDSVNNEWEDADTSSDEGGDPGEGAVTNGDDNAPANVEILNDLTEAIDQVSRSACPSLGYNLGWLSVQTEEMAVSNVTDAMDFFSGVMSMKNRTPTWEHLRRLTLTSHTMIAGIGPEHVNAVLLLGAKAAKHMPSLQMMELYKVDQFGAAVFRYTADMRSTTASWESTWEFRAEPIVREYWADVARKHTSHELEFLPEVLLGEYQGPFTFINENLKSKDLVLHPTSLEDMLSKKMDKCQACHGFCAHPKTGVDEWTYEGTYEDGAEAHAFA
ncbi:hypothetical protein CPLU01_02141 [Colletotrichum plurivorum]|uniref:DUF6546 domain-containing protein n=1 Tax=Colletotrichum plurivorum TaxID=2175906 RepID=A0A8H6KXS4_9PEZI|nr:hypothetical protein CPLU01_02141 [Colletotrichum plurivorum]